MTVLADLRKRKKALEAERDDLGLQIGHYKTLERAFGKDGVPALLIEQALPEIEMKANQILGRLSDDSMHLHFETQAKYKDEKRKELRETLEIQVSVSPEVCHPQESTWNPGARAPIQAFTESFPV